MEKIKQIDDYNVLLLDSDNIAKDMYFAQKNGIKSILISSRIGNFKLTNTDFLQDYPEIERLYISTYDVIDYSAICYLKKLRKLSIDILAKDNQEIDFNYFPYLEEISFDWRKKTKNIENSLRLKYVNISKLKAKNLDIFSKLNNLESFSVFESSIENLEGIENCKKIKRLTLVRCSKLTSIEIISQLSELEHIKISNCKNIASFKVLESLKNIKFLELHNCGEIESIAPIKKLKNLKEFYYSGNTNFLDNNE